MITMSPDYVAELALYEISRAQLAAMYPEINEKDFEDAPTWEELLDAQ